MKRKILNLAIFICLSFTCLLVACDKSEVHTHSFSQWDIINEATCTLNGLKIRKCNDCGIIEYEKIEKTGHTEVEDSAVEATCAAEGLTAGSHCDVCGEILIKQQTVSKKEHTIEIDYAISATCAKSGLSQGKHCSDCGYVIEKQEIIEPLGHYYGIIEITKPATCQTLGTKRYSCNNCENYYEDDYKLETYDATEIFKQAQQYTGEIIVFDKLGNSLALGTAFAIGSNQIITNFHVIDGAYSAEFYLGDDIYEITAVLGYDEDIDIAILQVNASNLVSANLCSEKMSEGSEVYAFGSSKGYTGTFSRGIVSCGSRIVDGVEHVQHTADVSSGNSGGPIINAYGEVVGIHTWHLVDAQNMNFAVSISELDNVVVFEPISLADLYIQQYGSARDKLVLFLMNNATSESEDTIYYEEIVSDVYFALLYDTKTDELFVDIYYSEQIENDVYTYFLMINLDHINNVFDYIGILKINNEQSEIYGTINGLTFNENVTKLNYTSYEGFLTESDEIFDLLLEVWSAYSYSCIIFLDSTIIENNINTSIYELGFKNISFSY